ncbi:MAG: DUF4331 domain-containing protein [Planctomycetota bacterium]
MMQCSRRGVQALITVLLLGGLGAPASVASSHREAPGTSKDPQADNTDLYAFVSPENPSRVVFVANFVPLQIPYGGPNFFGFGDTVVYKIKIDNNGDTLADIVYTFDFATEVRNPGTFLYNTGPITSLQDENWNIRQFYRVTRTDKNGTTTLGKRLISPPCNVGPQSTPDYESLAQQAIQTLADGSRVFCGQREEAFFADLAGIFDLLTIRVPPGDQGGGVDGLAELSIHSICLEVPIDLLEGENGDHIIGVWSTASRPKNLQYRADGDHQTSGKLIQVSRLGMPLVNEAVIPVGFKDRFNGSSPRNDLQFLDFVLDPELGKLLTALYGISVPPAPRNDLVAVFLTGVEGLNQPVNVVPGEMLRLNMSIPPAANPNRLGVLAGDLAGFPNGRRLLDDVVDIELRAVAGVLVNGFDIAPNNRLGDGVDANDVPFLTTFPFMASPPDPFTH